MKISRTGYLIAGAALLAALVIGLWKPWSGNSVAPPAVRESAKPAKPAPGRAPVRSDPSEEKPAVRVRSEEDKKDLQQISDWIGDESVTPEMAARNLWKLASDPARPEYIRAEALVHAMNLTDDETFRSEVIPLLGKKNVWPDALGEKILDDLYNRPDALKLQGTVALFENSTGELRASLRELLAFDLGEPDAETLSDADLIRRAREKLK